MNQTTQTIILFVKRMMDQIVQMNNKKKITTGKTMESKTKVKFTLKIIEKRRNKQ